MIFKATFQIYSTICQVPNRTLKFIQWNLKSWQPKPDPKCSCSTIYQLLDYGVPQTKMFDNYTFAFTCTCIYNFVSWQAHQNCNRETDFLFLYKKTWFSLQAAKQIGKKWKWRSEQQPRNQQDPLSYLELHILIILFTLDVVQDAYIPNPVRVCTFF